MAWVFRVVAITAAKRRSSCPAHTPSLVGDSQARAGTTGLYPRRCEGRTNRIVSLLSRKALDDLHLEVGSVAVAVVESTAVVVERAAPAGVPAR